MDVKDIALHTEARAHRAARHATWHLEIYGTRIPVDNDEGHPTWVTLVPVCPHCIEPAGHDRRAVVRIDPELPWRPIVVCQCCEEVLGPLEETSHLNNQPCPITSEGWHLEMLIRYPEEFVASYQRAEYARCQALVDMTLDTQLRGHGR
jgi:hypothetical protein